MFCVYVGCSIALLLCRKLLRLLGTKNDVPVGLRGYYVIRLIMFISEHHEGGCAVAVAVVVSVTCWCVCALWWAW